MQFPSASSSSCRCRCLLPAAGCERRPLVRIVGGGRLQRRRGRPLVSSAEFTNNSLESCGNSRRLPPERAEWTNLVAGQCGCLAAAALGPAAGGWRPAAHNGRRASGAARGRRSRGQRARRARRPPPSGCWRPGATSACLSFTHHNSAVGGAQAAGWRTGRRPSGAAAAAALRRPAARRQLAWPAGQCGGRATAGRPPCAAGGAGRAAPARSSSAGAGSRSRRRRRRRPQLWPRPRAARSHWRRTRARQSDILRCRRSRSTRRLEANGLSQQAES